MEIKYDQGTMGDKKILRYLEDGIVKYIAHLNHNETNVPIYKMQGTNGTLIGFIGEKSK